jgi:DNA-binding MarR family transcriptional regulator
MDEYEDLPLGYLLRRIMAIVRPPVSAELRALGLGLPQFICMRILSKSPGRSSAELARETNVSPQAMDQLLSGLENAGVVTRPATVSSGRVRPAQLTPKGKALLKRAEAAVRVADERILAHLTPSQQKEFKQVLYAMGSQSADNAAASRISPNFDQ